jgi:hypothetical protein
MLATISAIVDQALPHVDVALARHAEVIMLALPETLATAGVGARYLASRIANAYAPAVSFGVARTAPEASTGEALLRDGLRSLETAHDVDTRLTWSGTGT